jgi:hypothetical protein
MSFLPYLFILGILLLPVGIGCICRMVWKRKGPTEQETEEYMKEFDRLFWKNPFE